jgi:hypothetical protein
MFARAMLVYMFIMGASAAIAAHGEVVSYGVGLESCKTYLTAKELQGPDEVSILDWLAGYVSGVNSTTLHFNNILGDSNLTGAVYWLDDYCRAHPPTEIAVALDMMIMRARSTTARNTVELTTYGTGYKSCEIYLGARGEDTAAQIAFIDWLGGYVSGFNAVSVRTDDALSDADLTPAVYWLDNYCRANPDPHFVEAIEARLAIPSRGDRHIVPTQVPTSAGVRRSND